MLKLNNLQKEIFLSRYAANHETDWSQCAQRVSDIVVKAEKEDLQQQWNKSFFESINNGWFMPGGRILFGAGRRDFNMLNCYRLHCEDNIESIGQMIKDSYMISSKGGGIGFNFSDIRPTGDDIQNIKYSAPGSVSVMKMVNEVGNHVRSGGSRRTALIAILNVTHPDILDFLHVKLDLKELNNFNISVGITNEFIDAVKKNKPWKFIFNGKHYSTFEADRVNGSFSEKIRIIGLNKEDALNRAIHHYRISPNDKFENLIEYNLTAKEIWDLILENSWKSGDPGLYNIDLCNTHTNVSYFENLNSPNPCGELPLPKYGNCCLGHINLAEMVDGNGVNWKRFAKTIRIGIRFLDDVLSVNHFPVNECKAVGEKSRRIGLGVTGLHYMLIKLGHIYGDEKCLEFIERLFSTFRDEAYKASIELAKEKGTFPAFDVEKYSKEGFFLHLPPRIQTDIKKYGIRNAVMLTLAPCGTNSMVLGVSSGIEPIFAPVYIRRFRDKNVVKEEYLSDALFTDYYINNKDLSKFRGAYDISVRDHIRMQATIQKYIDSAISKTTNLPNNFPLNELSDVILEFAPYVKGFTIYRSGSKGSEPLEPIDISDNEKLNTAMMNAGVSVESLSNCKSGSCEI